MSQTKTKKPEPQAQPKKPAPALKLKPLSEDEIKNVIAGIGWPSHAAY